MDEATNECRGGGPWELLYADDIVFSAESRVKVGEERGRRSTLAKRNCWSQGTFRWSRSNLEGALVDYVAEVLG